MTRIIAASILFFAFCPQPLLAEPASDAQMAKEAIMPYAPRDADQQAEFLQKYAERIRDLATHAPDDVQPATVFFNTGLSYREMHELREDLGFEVIDVGMKAPQGDRGVIMSLSGGMANLFAIKGTFEERLTFMIRSEQKCFAKRARLMSGDEAQAMADLATNPFFVYSARIFGPNKVLGELQQQPTVTGVILNLRPSIISDFEAAKSDTGPHYYLMPGFHC